MSTIKILHTLSSPWVGWKTDSLVIYGRFFKGTDYRYLAFNVKMSESYIMNDMERSPL
jgi:hypothetical protein